MPEQLSDFNRWLFTQKTARRGDDVAELGLEALLDLQWPQGAENLAELEDYLIEQRGATARELDALQTAWQEYQHALVARAEARKAFGVDPVTGLPAGDGSGEDPR